MDETARAEVAVLDVVPGTLWLGAWHSVNVVVWLQTATAEVVARLDRAFVARFESIEERMSTIHVVVPEVGPPGPDARKALVEMNDRLAYTVACGAIVIERGGLSGLAVRSAVTGMMIVAPKQYRVKVFDALEACATWVSEQHERTTSLSMPADEISRFLRYARKTAK